MTSVPSAMQPARPGSTWRLDPPFGARTVLIVILAALLLWHTGKRVEIDRMAILTAEGVLAAVGIGEHSQVASGLAKIATSLFPIQISERTEVARIENFDPSDLPWFSFTETVEQVEQRLNPATLTMEATVTTREYLVEPIGYLKHVLVKKF
jgi:phosphonate transport system permease protein